EDRHHVFQSLFKHFHRILARPFANDIEGFVQDPLSFPLLSVNHQPVDQPRHQLAVEDRIGKNFPTGYRSLTWHAFPSFTARYVLFVVSSFITSSAVWFRIWSGLVSDPARRLYPAPRGQCDN